jgi:hypothetical protein
MKIWTTTTTTTTTCRRRRRKKRKTVHCCILQHERPLNSVEIVAVFFPSTNWWEQHLHCYSCTLHFFVVAGKKRCCCG